MKVDSPGLAFNLGDLTMIARTEPVLFSCLIQPILTETTHDFNNRKVDATYVLTCPLSQERIDAIIEVIRRPPGGHRAGISRYRLRMKHKKYDRSERGRWVSV